MAWHGTAWHAVLAGHGMRQVRRQVLAMFGYVWLCVAMFGYDWLCSTLGFAVFDEMTRVMT